MFSATITSHRQEYRDEFAENKRIVQAFYDAANRGDTEGFMGQLADDVTWTNIGSTKYSGTFTGKNDLTARLFGPLFGRRHCRDDSQHYRGGRFRSGPAEVQDIGRKKENESDVN